MRVVPVLDLMAGVVVRGVGGRRAEYCPVVSRLTDSSQPIDVAQAFREQFGMSELYIADLDAIAGKPPALELFRALKKLGFSLWIDAGLHRAADTAVLVEAGVDHVVAGLETLDGPHELERLSERCVFSLDLKAGQPLADWGRSPWEIACMAVECGMRRLLLLDLARVGEGQGTGTEELCCRLSQTFPHVEISAGGGVRGADDLERLRQSGVHAALVASALHDGRLTREILLPFTSP